MSKIRVSFAYAYYSNPTVGKGYKDLNPGEGFSCEGITVSSDHKTITLEPYVGDYKLVMECNAALKPTLWTRISNLLTGKSFSRSRFVSVTKKTTFSLKSVLSVTFSNGWDDNTHSFHKI